MKSAISFVLVYVLAAIFSVVPVKAYNQSIENYGNIPLSFTPNQGQFDSPVMFFTRGSGCSMFFTQTCATYLLDVKIRESSDQPHEIQFALKVNYLNANSYPDFTGEDLLPGESNYFIGNDQSNWHTNVVSYEKIRLNNIYDGIDLVYYGNQNRIKYDFVVQPGAAPSQILLQYDLEQRNSDASLAINENGELIISTPIGTVTECKPYCYQIIDGDTRIIEVVYKIVDYDLNNFTFEIATYNPAYPLVIDPELVFSTFLGGSSEDFGNAMAIDTFGNLYIGSYAFSSNFPISTGAYDEVFNGGTYDAVITKLNPSGSDVIYSTFIGSSGNWDNINSIAIDENGNAYLTGYACAPDFPTTSGAYDESYNGGLGDAYVMKLNPSGDDLLYSTFIGESVSDEGCGIKIDEDGKAYVSGTTTSANFPTTSGAFDESFHGINDVFVVKLNAAGSDLIYSTFVGGSGEDDVAELALDAWGNVYITGRTTSQNFPVTSGAFDESHNGGVDAYIAKINATGNDLVYATFIGGSSDERGYGIDIDVSGNVYITGPTNSSNFPTTPSAYDTTHNGGNDAFITKLDQTGNTLIYSSYVGGNGNDCGYDLSIDNSGNVFVTGVTNSTSFPTTPGAYDESQNGDNDAFILELNAAGTSLKYSTYLGAGGDDSGRDIMLDQYGYVIVTGYTASSSFPTTPDAYDVGYNGGTSDGFIAKFAFTPTALISYLIDDIISDDGIQHGLKQSLTVKLENVLAKLDRNNIQAAINQLEAFINEVEAKQNKRNGLVDEKAEELIAVAHQIIVILRDEDWLAKRISSDNDSVISGKISLKQNSPNPFNPATTITYEIHDGATGNVTLKVYDLRGALVCTLIDQTATQGIYSVMWDGTDQSGQKVSSGIYVYQLKYGSVIESNRMMLLR